MIDSDVNYGLLCYSTDNIGDEIQSIAASRFLPRIDSLINREMTNKFKSERGGEKNKINYERMVDI